NDKIRLSRWSIWYGNDIFGCFGLKLKAKIGFYFQFNTKYGGMVIIYSKKFGAFFHFVTFEPIILTN
ncbi:MAG TPA: hypothetical protein DCQ31_01690, partial [Bacteroidales bacterium]|nr:hypothetical protein [Bacteroidales bacterium]